ncbi:MAG TPA: type I-MYXAN CRISPR-associated protein Cas6/Cmx6 [Sedimenticola sp.]|nr:type I-MYXAN CRISPR-associated protein Cas6/Cmx6 [Sedimenticola sp.]
MYWQEEENEEQFQVPERVVDLAFSIRCPTLPVDHAWELAGQIGQRLPWFGDEPRSGLHIIHGADSGNGWERPQGADELLYLSRRTRLVLRLPSERIGEASSRLAGETLTIDGHRMEVGRAKPRPLARSTILYSRYTVAEPDQDEEQFVEGAVGALRELRLRFKKILCGKSFELSTPEGPVFTRSLMVGGLPYEDAVLLQEEGLGPLRTMGCGIFLPQKEF